ncbi:DUF502 domain-containing protein [Solimonas marina]|uniref:DUF502 domain-containing protein n=1 Tax=Solimonas marina TaxID=2714601 RepID=A0A970B6P2_9GAMM|nr:DUF502 domain-containing protein [Solimonas marina]NKF24697.1 DUF502 domain-containing protein [Solimonas marina]
MPLQPLLSDAARKTMRKAASIFFAGLIAVLPILVTFSLVMWLIGSAESVLGGVLSVVLPGQAYHPGMGLIFALILIFIVGLGMQGLVSRQVFVWIDQNLNRIPLIKTIYGAVRDLTDLVSPKQGGQKLGRVVMVQWPNQPIRLVGFVTVEELSRFEIAADEDCVAVYMPMSYQIGGYTAIVPRQYLTPLDMSVEDAMRFVITAGVSRSEGSRVAATVAPASTTTPPPPSSPPGGAAP